MRDNLLVLKKMLDNSIEVAEQELDKHFNKTKHIDKTFHYIMGKIDTLKRVQEYISIIESLEE